MRLSTRNLPVKSSYWDGRWFVDGRMSLVVSPLFAHSLSWSLEEMWSQNYDFEWMITWRWGE